MVLEVQAFIRGELLRLLRLLFVEQLGDQVSPLIVGDR